MAYFRLLRSFNLPFRLYLSGWAWTVLAHTADIEYAECQYAQSYSCIKVQGQIFGLHWQNVWLRSPNQFESYESFKALVLSRVFSNHSP